MIITFDCPHCQQPIKGKLTAAASEATCLGCGKASPIPKTGVAPGVILGDALRIVRELGKSSLGKVYLGYQEHMGREVRVEILSGMVAADPETFGRFRREVALTADLDHPNLLRAIDAGEDNGVHFLVTQHRPGITLTEHLQQHGPLTERDAAALLLPVAKALAFAWREHKLLHRNVKPANIIIAAEDGRPLLSDLGIAKSVDDDIDVTAAGFAVGTPQYMSPEQGRASELDFRSDMYSLGIVFYECVTGAVPFDDASPILVLQQQIDVPHTPVQERNPSVSAAAAKVIDRMLEKDRERRYPDWKTLIGDLAAVAAARPLPSAPKSKRPPARRASSGKTAGRPMGKKTGVSRSRSQPAAGGMSRQDIERIAQQMFKPSLGKKLMWYGLSALVPLLAFGVYKVAIDSSSRAAPGRWQEPVAPRGCLSAAQGRRIG